MVATGGPPKAALALPRMVDAFAVYERQRRIFMSRETSASSLGSSW